MDLGPYLTRLREDLTTAAAAGDEQTRRTAALLGAALEPAARLMIMDALSDLAAEVTASLPDHVVEVRLDGRDVRVSVSQQDGGPSGAPPPPDPGPYPDASGDISRITLRLLDQLKSQAERAAAQQGVSLNSWVSQAVQSALHGKPWGGDTYPAGWPHDERRRRGQHRVQGWVQG
ncbi:MAG: toxin-antitoxin system HicB family antitoxin [Actinomycetota bacterium]|nr:toxin-antitoxin system HicB family antitoxin [Actinomycetota bacterium]